MYDKDFEYAGTRLDGTYVSLTNGTPIYIERVGANGIVDFVTLELANQKRKSCHLDDINCSPLTLGYANTPQGAYYLTRIPARKYRQGLTGASVHIKCLGKNVSKAFSGDMLHNCVKGNYIPFKEILRKMTENPAKINPFYQEVNVIASWAWSRRWAVRKTGDVEYRGKVVGKISNGAVELSKAYQYLKEELEESL